ncbi:MAG TPA: fused MFS/spermidine synthase [Steroidobacteraceae bacterium]|jgi:spermidine synthase|nr:fused MFS/spermidine synthase [Steroidobacteraceae bacterium]
MRQLCAIALMVASGFAALGYQIVWTQQSALWLGHESAAVLAVVAGFFGGVAVGALGFGKRIDASRQPVRWYAACEAIIGLWSLALLFLMAPVSGALLDLIGAQPAPLWQWFVVFIGVFLLLLPATAAMGATLPAMERIVADLRSEGASIAMLYAANTFGAVIGVLAAAFFLLPQLGLSFTAAICISANFLCAVAALGVFAPHIAAAPVAVARDARTHLSLLAATGVLGIGYEVLVVRVLSQVAENTVYTFAILLAVYLIGTALGAAGYGRWRARSRDRLLQLLSAACLLGVVGLSGAASFKALLLQAMGPGMSAALIAEAALAVTAFLLPTIVMGALFSHLATEARAAGISFGRAIGANTLGAALAPPLCGLLLLPLLGSTFALLLIAVGYLVLVAPRAWLAPAQLSVTVAAGLLAVWAPSLALIKLPEGARLVSYAEGVSATVSVIEAADGVATLHINNRQQEGSSATLLTDGRQGLLPILLHPAPRRALFLGLGTGVTARAAAEDAGLRVDAVELLPEVIAASSRFAGAFERENPRLSILTADARRFVRAAADHYDVIVADNFHPARSGSGALYTVEHFAAVRERLTTAGVFCQWLPLHQLDLDTLRSIVRSFLHVYPRGWAMLATNSLETPVLGLVARRDGEPVDVPGVRRRLAAMNTPRPLADFGITDDLAVLGNFIAGPGALARFAGDAPLNTDDHPVVTYLAPRVTYAPNSAPRDRLLELLADVDIEPAELFVSNDARWTRRLAAYWQARNRYLQLGRDVKPTYDARAMLAQVREPLLAVLRISPDFRPAYDPLLRMAYGIAPSDTAAARSLLTQLEREQPARPEAAEALRALDASL